MAESTAALDRTRGTPRLPLDAEFSSTFEALGTEVHVWIARPDLFRDDRQLTRYRSWLSGKERARADRYLYARDRHLFLIAHALLRSTLSRYAELPPDKWEFAVGEQGRPALADNSSIPSTAGPIRFSLSHTRGLVACLVSNEIECGVDVEKLNEVKEPRTLAFRYFSQRERDDLDKLPDDRIDTRFLQYWTLKEAYLKARGFGLSLPLDRFGFTCDLGGTIDIAFESPIEDHPDHWQFALSRPTADHILAVAVRRGSGANRTIVSREVRPSDT